MYNSNLKWQIFKPKDTYTIDRDTYLYKPSPREATSVAMRMGAFPERNSAKQKWNHENQAVHSRQSGVPLKQRPINIPSFMAFTTPQSNFK